jgi:phospholipid/cholesterol/gamma-HCH transport system permease protein
MSSTPPLSLFPERPGKNKTGFVTRLGARTLGSHHFVRRLVQTLLLALAAPFQPGVAAALVSRRVTVRQIFFTGFEALPLVSVIALMVGATIIVQAQITSELPAEIIGMLLVAVVLREVAPLVTAIVVAGRSGTAIATELGNMKVNQEILGLVSVGIDPHRFVVFPRLVGVVTSVLVLTVYFGALAIIGGGIASAFLGRFSFAALRSGFMSALLPADLPLFVLKGTGLGFIAGWLPCHFGLEVGASPTEVPQRASQAVVLTMLACVGFNTIVTVVFYWVAGPPVR